MNEFETAARVMVGNFLPFTKPTDRNFQNWDVAKQCAIITVDAIIRANPTSPLKSSYIELYSDMVYEAIEYWNEVKRQIKLL